MFDWNRERHKTRDRLLEYTFNSMPSHPHSNYIPTVLPWQNTSLDYLAYQLYQIAQRAGFTDTEENFIKLFSGTMNNKQVLFASFSTFPQMGDYNMLYFDIDEKILYYWDNEYIPVNAMLIANTTLEGGGA